MDVPPPFLAAPPPHQNRPGGLEPLVPPKGDRVGSSDEDSPSGPRYYRGSLAGKKLVKKHVERHHPQNGGGGGLLPTLNVAMQLSPLPVAAGPFGWGGADDSFSRSPSKAQTKIKIVDIQGPLNEQPLLASAKETLLAHMRQQRSPDAAVPVPAGRHAKAARVSNGGSPRTLALDTLVPSQPSPTQGDNSMGLVITCTGANFRATKARHGALM